MMLALLTTLPVFLVSLILTRYFIRPNAIVNIIDNPNERSLHDNPVQRTGGIAIVLAICVGESVVFGLNNSTFDVDTALFWAGALVVALISFVDDWFDLSAITRLFFQIIAAGLLVAGDWVPDVLSIPYIVIEWGYLFASIFTIVFVVWMTNLYNFMDGMDGFAAGMTLFGFSTLGIVGYLQGEILFAAMNGVIASSAAGFLIFNFPPARIFMGDSGSATLGYLAAGMLLWADKSGIIPLWLGMLLFSPFIIDASVTLIRRLVSGEKIWLAHKTHYYQRLVESGLGHRCTVLAEYMLMFLVSLSVLSLSQNQSEIMGLVVLLGWIITYILLAFAIQHRDRAGVGKIG